MIFRFAVKEILTSMKTVRFVVAMMVCCVLLPMSVWVLSTDYLHEVEDYQSRVGLEDRREAGKNYQIGVNRPVPPLSPLFRGVVSESANTIELRYMIAWNRPVASAVQSPTHDIFPTVDLTFIIGMVLSAMALIFSYDAVSGEKDKATLRLVMSNSIPRYQVVLGKWLGLSAVLLIPLLAGLLLSLMIFFSISGVSFSGDDALALTLALVVSVIYLSLFTLLGITVSTLTRNPSVSIVICLGVWGFITIILPQAAIALSDSMVEIPAPQKIERDLRIAYNEYATAMQQNNYRIIDEAVARGEGFEQFRQRTQLNQRDLSLENRRRANNIEREFWMQVAAQEKVGQWMSLISPFGSYNLTVINLADTGPEGQREFLIQAYRYGEKFFEDIWTKAFQENTEFESWADIIESHPPFKYHQVSLAARLERALLPMGSLLVYLVILLMGTVIAFNRYDVR